MRSLILGLFLVGALGTPYHDAIGAGDDKALMHAIAADPGQINEIGPGGQTPLMNAVLSGNAMAVKILLAARADTSIGEKDGYTPMHGAGFQGRAEIASMLIKHGLDPSDMHRDGYTPLHRACWGGEKRHTDMVKVLLEAGVSPKEPSGSGQLPIDMVRGNPMTRQVLSEWLKKKDEI